MFKRREVNFKFIHICKLAGTLSLAYNKEKALRKCPLEMWYNNETDTSDYTQNFQVLKF
jgi:hypothetical protein